MEDAARPWRPWLIKSLIPPKGVVVLYGPTGVGKTFLVLDLVLSMAAGVPWPLGPNEQLDAARLRADGLKRISPKANVLYWIGEGRENAEQRVRAWIAEHACKSGATDGMEFAFVEGYVTNLLLSGRRGGKAAEPVSGDHNALGDMHPNLKMLVNAFPDIHDTRPGRPTPVLVVDTLSATHPDMDENDTRDAGRVMENCRRLAEDLDGLVILVHHSGKGRGFGPRGHSKMMGDPDTILHVTRTRKASKDILRLQVEKQRMLYEAPDMYFTLDSANNEQGMPPVLRPLDPEKEGLKPARRRRDPRLSRADQKTIQVLTLLRKEAAKANDPHFRKQAFARKARAQYKWSESSTYSHLKRLEEEFGLIRRYEPPQAGEGGSKTVGETRAGLYVLEPPKSGEDPADEIARLLKLKTAQVTKT
ncbi:AAA domain-containing protein [Ruegeria intermedia]|uniref:AAA domain-containing protein n=2 Tax=Ruegeria intermedia TaxID=996115 RepID=A0A1M5BPA6_9RHOB|nr:AAA domain-containing protein [Ruegeria intermedia]